MKLAFLLLLTLFSFTLCFAQKKSTYDLLQGKWQSTNDKSNYLFFDKNHRKEIATGMAKWEDEIFVLSNSCKNNSDRDNEFPKETNKYISVMDSDLCWYIVELTPAKLTLYFMGIGNTLSYKRVFDKKEK
jgi:hypothetical protein